jgi:hypothetical protein
MKTFNVLFGVSLAQYNYESYEISDYGSDSYSESYYGESVDEWKSDRQRLKIYIFGFFKEKQQLISFIKLWKLRELFKRRSKLF